VRPPGQVLPDDLFAPLFKHIGAPLEEQHAKDGFLELRGVHLAAQDIGCREEVPLKLRQGELAHNPSYIPSVKSSYRGTVGPRAVERSLNE
jgi:hypothetical protein